MPYLRCFDCGQNYKADDLVWRCKCGGVLDVEETSLFPSKELEKKSSGFWRFRKALGWEAETPPVSLGEVETPLLKRVLAGREVEELQPGANDIRHLRAGVYFLRSADRGSRSDVSRVLVLR